MPASAAFHLWTGAVLAVVLALAVRTDLRERRVPDGLLAAGATTLLASRAVGPASAPGLPAACAWALVLGGALTALACAAPRGMGMGDAKLVAVLALALGPGAVVALGVACAAAAAGGALAAVRIGAAAARRAGVPFAPLLAAGSTVAWAAGWP